MKKIKLFFLLTLTATLIHSFAFSSNSLSKAEMNEEASRKFLQKNSERFGIKDPSVVRHIRTIITRTGEHFLYQQFYGPYPVVGGQICVSMNGAHSIIAANGKFHSISKITESFITDKQVGEQSAERLFGGKAYSTGIFVYPGVAKAHLVRRIEIDAPSGSWLLYVDADDPHLIRYAAGTSVSAFQGEGEVWNENPLTTPKRAVQILPNMDSSHTLSGNFVRLYDGNFQQDTQFPIRASDFTRAKEPDRKFNYAEEDARVTEVMAYYHINRVHDRWRSLGFTGLDSRAPIFVNIAATDGGPGFDNAYYRRAQKFRTGIYVFGGGDQYNNNGLDAEILYHEYGHGVLDHINPGFLEARDSNYPLALHEAFGDISAAALSKTPRLFDFADRPRNGGKWNGRNMSNHKRFPKDVIWKQIGISEPHHTGLILDGAWWDLQKKIGALPAQELMYEAINQVSAEVDFFQIRDAMLTADENINSGRNSQNILSAFAKHGLSGPNPGQNGTLTIKSVVVAAYSPSTDYQLTSQISRGQIASIVVQYEASGLAPGYNLVPEDLQFDRPAGSNAFIVAKIDEVKNGSHTAVHDALHIFEIPTDTSTTTGTYTIRFTPRLGGTNHPLPEQIVTFEVR